MDGTKVIPIIRCHPLILIPHKVNEACPTLTSCKSHCTIHGSPFQSSEIILFKPINWKMESGRVFQQILPLGSYSWSDFWALAHICLVQPDERSDFVHIGAMPPRTGKKWCKAKREHWNCQTWQSPKSSKKIGNLFLFLCLSIRPSCQVLSRHPSQERTVH